MGMKAHGIPGTFYTRGYIIWYETKSGGSRIRISTGQTDLESAVEWVKMRPFGSRTVRKALELPHQFVTKAVNQARYNARAKGILFKLTVDDFHELYKRANGHCEVSGLPFSLKPMEGCNRRPYAPSIDRIDRVRGYVKENCRMVCASVNLAMNEFGEDVLWDIASSMFALRRKKAKSASNCTTTPTGVGLDKEIKEDAIH